MKCHLIPACLKTLCPGFLLLTDAAACTGVLVAAAGILASHLTQMPVWDSLASIAVGGVMGTMAGTVSVSVPVALPKHVHTLLALRGCPWHCTQASYWGEPNIL
jgi:hypothetical protein